MQRLRLILDAVRRFLWSMYGLSGEAQFVATKKPSNSEGFLASDGSLHLDETNLASGDCTDHRDV